MKEEFEMTPSYLNCLLALVERTSIDFQNLHMFRKLIFGHTIIRLRIICDLAYVVQVTSQSLLTYLNTVFTQLK